QAAAAAQRPRQPSGLLSLADVPPRPSEPARDDALPSKHADSAVGREPTSAPEPPPPSSIPPSAEPFGVRDSEPGLEPVLREHALPRTGASFQALWPEHERGQVVELETAIREGRFADGVRFADELVSRTFAGVASALGGPADAPRDPALVVSLLGLEGRRYFEFRRFVKEARNGGDSSEVEALTAFGFAIEARLARTRAT